MYDWLTKEIAAGSFVITANHRLAKTLLDYFNQHERARGLDVWPTPQIRSLDSWLIEGINTCAAQDSLRVRLGSQAAALVWEQCIPQQAETGFLSRAAFVREARQAWARLQDWNIALEELREFARTSDERLFLRCANAYEQQLEKNAWLDDDLLCAEFCRLLKAGAISTPDRIVIAGFDRTKPACEKLWAILREAGVAIVEAPGSSRSASVSIVEAPHAEAELRAAGLWARDLLLEDPEKRIAIVVPGLEQNAARFSRLIREGLVPGWQTAGEDFAGCLNVSYGRKLAEYPLVAVALLVLRWINGGLNVADVSVLLRAPFVGVHSDDGRSRAEQQLRESPDRFWSRASLCRVVEGMETASVLDWVARIRAIDKFAAIDSQMRSPGSWAESFAGCLEAVGWPGTRALGSAEFQLLNRWRELLNEFARLQPVSRPITISQAVELLGTMANDVVFQAQSVNGTVNLLGVLETAGMEFDAIWCAGMEASGWPVSSQPASLLPRRLQIERGMPDSTPAESLQFGRGIFSRLRSCADQVVFSWAQIEEETELLPSPCLAELVAAKRVQAVDPGWYATWLAADCVSVRVPEDPVPPVGDEEKVSGGAYTLQRQRKEPLQALASGRLRAKPLTQSEPGISAAMRGKIVHWGLSALYGEKPDRATLGDWQGEALSKKLRQAAEKGVARYLADADPVLRRLLTFERDRLQGLLAEFIEQELERPPFAVAVVEGRYELRIDRLLLQVQIDRVDELPDGGVVIIDYKTGQQKIIANRNGEIADLQLAVYAFAVPGLIRGLVIANLDARRVSYAGAGDDESWSVLADRQKNWREKLAAWMNEVQIHAGNLSKGDARVNLQLATKDARPLAVLSRIAELKRAD